jgi:hypothetical protein
VIKILIATATRNAKNTAVITMAFPVMSPYEDYLFFNLFIAYHVLFSTLADFGCYFLPTPASAEWQFD